jgi:hypothetical protein
VVTKRRTIHQSDTKRRVASLVMGSMYRERLFHLTFDGEEVANSQIYGKTLGFNEFRLARLTAASPGGV